VAELYLVEHRLPRITRAELAILQTTLSSACARLTARGESVSYLGSTFLPTSARLLSLFEASNADAVRNATVSSHAPPAGLEVAIALPNQEVA
jgi:hypothetical protein